MFGEIGMVSRVITTPVSPHFFMIEPDKITVDRTENRQFGVFIPKQVCDLLDIERKDMNYWIQMDYFKPYQKGGYVNLYDLNDVFIIALIRDLVKSNFRPNLIKNIISSLPMKYLEKIDSVIVTDGESVHVYRLSDNPKIRIDKNGVYILRLNELDIEIKNKLNVANINQKKELYINLINRQTEPIMKG